MREPMPLQREQGIEVTIWPRIELRTRRTSPSPAHSTQGTGDVPGAHPEPSQVEQRWASVTVTSCVAPKAASSRVMLSEISASGPGWGPRRCCGWPPRLPKNMSKMSWTEPPPKGLPPAPTSEPNRS